MPKTTPSTRSGRQQQLSLTHTQSSSDGGACHIAIRKSRTTSTATSLVTSSIAGSASTLLACRQLSHLAAESHSQQPRASTSQSQPACPIPLQTMSHQPVLAETTASNHRALVPGWVPATRRRHEADCHDLQRIIVGRAPQLPPATHRRHDAKHHGWQSTAAAQAMHRRKPRTNRRHEARRCQSACSVIVLAELLLLFRWSHQLSLDIVFAHLVPDVTHHT